MSELIKAYADELDLVNIQITDLHLEAVKNEGLYFTKEFISKLDYLNDRKAALRYMINRLGEK